MRLGIGVAVFVFLHLCRCAVGAEEALSAAADTVYVMDPVEVTEERWRDVMAAPAQESPGLELSITTVDREAIGRRGAATVIEALEQVPGAWVETRGRKVKQFFSVRGQKYPYPEYSVDGAWQREFHELPYFFSAAEVERIKVVRSSAALLKGLSGLAGVVDIVPREYGAPETSAEVEYGTFGGYRLRLGHGAGREQFSYAFGAQRSGTEGPTGRHAAEEMTGLRGSVGWRPTERLAMRAHLFYLDGKRELARAEEPAVARLHGRWRSSILCGRPWPFSERTTDTARGVRRSSSGRTRTGTASSRMSVESRLCARSRTIGSGRPVRPFPEQYRTATCFGSEDCTITGWPRMASGFTWGAERMWRRFRRWWWTSSAGG